MMNLFTKLNKWWPYFNSEIMVYHLAIGDLKSPISAVLAGIF
jgi:hypothetical protein